MFDRLSCKNGIFALHFTETSVFKSDVDLKVSADIEIEEEADVDKYADFSELKYGFYDRNTKSFLAIPNIKIRERWIYFKSPDIPRIQYDLDSYRALPAAVDEQKKILYSFVYSRATVTTDYDHRENILAKQMVGQTETGEPLEETFYLTRQDKTLQVAIQKYSWGLREFLEAKIRTVNLRNGVLRLNLELKNCGYRISRIYLQLRSKTEQAEHDFILSEKQFGNTIMMKASIDLKPLKLTQFYWDIKAVAVNEENGAEQAIELRNHDRWMHRILYVLQLHYIYPDGNIVYPYKTKSRNIALQFRQKTEYDSWRFIFQEYLALFFYYVFGWYLKRKKIWLVYEKYSKSAQDNSLYFFKYCMEKLPEKERARIYYVIDKKSPDYQYVAPYEKQVIQFLSLKHMVYLMSAQLLISSDTRAHAYAWHSPNSVYRNMLTRKENVFLQHGVMAFKCCHLGLRKRSVNTSKLFVVSSDVEKQIILDYFGYDENEILVTGLARWDVLEDKSQSESRQIVLMPTWRTWLEEVSEADFVKSDYYKQYMQLLNNQRLTEVLERYNTTLNFYIHPKFQEYMGAFNAPSKYIRLIPFGEEPLNELMMKCSMMITDYSSAVWDVFYQGKPVVFFLFDLDMYKEVQGSYIDMEKDVFGDVSHNADELISLIEAYAADGFKEKPQFAAMRKNLIKYIDDKNSERIYQAIVKCYQKQ